jgi:hypothetical protein
MFKRLYQMLAWLAVANLFAAGGLVGYLVATGKLNHERVEQIAMVLRGDVPKSQVVTSQPAVVKQDAPETSRDELARLEAKKRFYELISERQQRDIDDRSSLNQSIQMDVNRQLEQVQAKEKEFQEVRRKTQESVAQDGFQQSLDMYSDMEPKLAKDVLMTRKDADVVQLFTKMDSNRRKKIINICKTPEETAWVARIMTQIGAMDAQQAVPVKGAGAQTSGGGVARSGG